jgi:hypothetical protein
MTTDDDLPFKIERCSKGYERLEGTIAQVADPLLAKAVFEMAVKRHPEEFILLRQKARVISKSIGDEG